MLEPEPPWNTKKTGPVSEISWCYVGTAGPTRLLVAAAELLGDVGLVLAKQLGVQADVARGIHAVNVAIKLLVIGELNVG